MSQLTVYPPISHPSVIDIEFNGSSLQEPCQAYAIYIAKTTFWDINKESIPTAGKYLADWEFKGQSTGKCVPLSLSLLELASHFADLLKEFVKLRRCYCRSGVSVWLMYVEKRWTSFRGSTTDLRGTHLNSKSGQSFWMRSIKDSPRKVKPWYRMSSLGRFRRVAWRVVGLLSITHKCFFDPGKLHDDFLLCCQETFCIYVGYLPFSTITLYLLLSLFVEN